MKITRKFKNIIYYVLGLITLPLILAIFIFFDSNSSQQVGIDEKIDLEIKDYRWRDNTSTYTIEGDSSLIIRDTQDINEVIASLNIYKSDSINNNSVAVGSASQINLEKYSINNKRFVGIDLNGFEKSQQNFLKNVMVSTPAFTAISSEIDQNAYLALFRDFKPSGKCKKPSSGIEDNEYILETEIRGEKLIVDSFEFANLNYSNPGCFAKSSTGFKMTNVVPVKELKSGIPFKLRLITNGKENNSFKLKLLLKTKNGKTLIKYPVKKEYVEGTITTLYGGEIITERFKIDNSNEAVAK